MSEKYEVLLSIKAKDDINLCERKYGLRILFCNLFDILK